MRSAAIGLTFSLALGMLVAAGLPARADEAEMQKAKQQIVEAKEALKTAKGDDYNGHRKRALTHLNAALDEVNKGINAAKRDEKHEDKKVQQLQKQQEKTQQKIDKLNAD